MKQFNILSPQQFLDLDPGSYTIQLVGGWGFLNFGRFAIEISKGRERIELFKPRWKVQTLEGGRRAKRWYEFKIENAGRYKIVVVNPKDLYMKRSGLFFSALFQKRIESKLIDVLIAKK
jgi:hypothetical protein